MPVFQCDKCKCVDNTACSNYWHHRHPMSDDEGKYPEPTPPLCSQCDPEIGKWHGMFKRMSAKGLILCDDGFLYSKEDVASDSFKFRMKHQGLKVVREITEDGVL